MPDTVAILFERGEVIVVFSLVVLFFAFVTPIYVRWMFKYYNKLETYHNPSDEGLKIKIFKLSKLNAIVSFFAASILLLFESFISGTGVPFTLETILALTIIIAVINFTIRLTSYSYIENPADGFPTDRLKKDAHNLGFAFIVSIWLFLFVGVGVSVANGNILWEYQLPTLSPLIALLYAMVIISTPIGLAIVSEKWLSYIDVPGTLVEEYDSSVQSRSEGESAADD